jgi:CubicO group peptidase (beta-lactamase class C family)
MRIDTLLKPLGGDNGPGGAVLVLRQGRLVYQKAVGLANLEERVPNTTATNFRIASLTKPFTALAVLMLIEQGKLSFHTAVTDVFPDFPASGRTITVRHLLTHTSGLPDYENLIPQSTTRQLKDRDVLRLQEGQKELTFPPGTKYHYSNSGYALLALIVEQVSGQRFAAFLHQRIFTPLGMQNTLAYEAGGPPVPRRAYGYSPSESGFQRTDQSLTSAVLGDGGIYTSVEDLAKWDRFLESPRLVKKATLVQAWTETRLTDGRPTGYGMGWEVGRYGGRRFVGHGGSTVGFRSDLEYFPEEKLTVILLCNRTDVRARDLVRAIVDLYGKGR